MAFEFKNDWKQLVWMAGSLLAGAGASGAYLADCDDAGDALRQAGEITMSVGEEPKAED